MARMPTKRCFIDLVLDVLIGSIDSLLLQLRWRLLPLLALPGVLFVLPGLFVVEGGVDCALSVLVPTLPSDVENVLYGTPAHVMILQGYHGSFIAKRGIERQLVMAMIAPILRREIRTITTLQAHHQPKFLFSLLSGALNKMGHVLG